ncbi:hypothetical protein ACTA71_004894 [Dictyostelium dimigraforme]
MIVSSPVMAKMMGISGHKVEFIAIQLFVVISETGPVSKNMVINSVERSCLIGYCISPETIPEFMIPLVFKIVGIGHCIASSFFKLGDILGTSNIADTQSIIGVIRHVFGPVFGKQKCFIKKWYGFVGHIGHSPVRKGAE